MIVIGNHCKEAYSHLSDLCFDLNLQQNYDNAYLGLCYILYAFTNPYILDSNQVIVILTLVMANKILEDENRVCTCNV